MPTLSRRHFLTAAATTAGAGLLAAYCGGSEKTTQLDTSPTAGSVKKGGVFNLASTIPALSIDPHTDVTMGLMYIALVYGYLFHQFQQPKGAPLVVFDHAESMENPDELTYLFKMRPGIHFQDLPPANAREITAEDVVYSFQRIGSLDSTPFWKSGMSDISAPDASTFKVRLSNIYAYAMGEFGGIRTAIVPKEAVAQFGDLKQNALGSGPFQVSRLSPTESIEMVRNPGYYVRDLPYLDGVAWKTFADDSSIQAAFKAQQIDVYTPPTKIQADNVAGSYVNVKKDAGLAIYMMNLNEIRAPVLQDVRVREALDISLDRDAIIDKLCFGEGNYTGPVSWGLEFWSLPQDELRTRLKRDVNKARQLIEAAGASDLTLELKTQNLYADLATMIKAQAAEAGITINIVSEELGTWVNDLFNQTFELMVGVGLPYGDEMLPLQFNHTYNWTRKANPVKLPDPAIDAILEEMLVTPDIYERQKQALDVTRKILDRHGPFIYLYAPYVYTARWDYVRGYEDVPNSQIAFTYDMWLDK
jgi:peptide/nickel transport system substrate-binding protein